MPVARMAAPTNETSDSIPFGPSAARSTLRTYPKKKIRKTPASVAISAEAWIESLLST